MAVSTITYKAPQKTMKMQTAFSIGTGTESLAANASMTITTNFDSTGVTRYGYVPIYAGNPKCVITNIWYDTANATIKFTAFNPTSSAQNINHAQARIGVLYTA